VLDKMEALKARKDASDARREGTDACEGAAGGAGARGVGRGRRGAAQVARCRGRPPYEPVTTTGDPRVRREDQGKEAGRPPGTATSSDGKARTAAMQPSGSDLGPPAPLTPPCGGRVPGTAGDAPPRQVAEEVSLCGAGPVWAPPRNFMPGCHPPASGDSKEFSAYRMHPTLSRPVVLFVTKPLPSAGGTGHISKTRGIRPRRARCSGICRILGLIGPVLAHQPWATASSRVVGEERSGWPTARGTSRLLARAMLALPPARRSRAPARITTGQVEIPQQRVDGSWRR